MTFRDTAEHETGADGAASHLLRWSATRSAENDEVVVEIAGELDLATTTELGHALAQIVSEKPRVVTVDCKRVTFMDSSGIRCLIGAAGRAEDVGCRLTVRHPNATVRRVMEVCGVDAILLDGSPEGPAATRR